MDLPLSLTQLTPKTRRIINHQSTIDGRSSFSKPTVAHHNGLILLLSNVFFVTGCSALGPANAQGRSIWATENGALQLAEVLKMPMLCHDHGMVNAKCQSIGSTSMIRLSMLFHIGSSSLIKLTSLATMGAQSSDCYLAIMVLNSNYWTQSLINHYLALIKCYCSMVNSCWLMLIIL